MGKWRLQDVIEQEISDYSSNGMTGNNLKIRFVLTYTPGKIGNFEEPPMLEWKEKITKIDHIRQTIEQSHQFLNMCDYTPQSPTYVMWPRRYIEAYNTAAGILKQFNYKGSVELFSLGDGGRRVTLDELGTFSDDSEKADAVRKYLKKKGGRLEVMIHDIPSLTTSLVVHKERLVLFDLGLHGEDSQRWKGFQYLNVDTEDQHTPNVQQLQQGAAHPDLVLPRDYKLNSRWEPPVKQPLPSAGECYS